MLSEAVEQGSQADWNKNFDKDTNKVLLTAKYVEYGKHRPSKIGAPNQRAAESIEEEACTCFEVCLLLLLLIS